MAEEKMLRATGNWLRTHVRVILSIACLVVAAAWWGSRFVGPTPPVPPELARLDPEIAALVEGGVTEVRRNRRRFEAWMRLGMIYEANGLFRYALSTYEVARSRRGARPDVWCRIAVTHERIGDLDSAVAAMRTAVELEPRLAPAHWQLGLWLLDLGDFDDAETHLRRALELDTGARPAWFGLVRLHLWRQENEEALELIDRQGLCEGANASYGWQLRSAACRQLGWLEEARAALARGGTRPPEFGAVWSEDLVPLRTGLAALRQDYARQRGTPEGERTLRRLLQRDPQDVLALNELATVHLGRRQFEPAREVLESALAVDPDDFQTNANIAVLLLTVGAAEGLEPGLAHIDRALAVQPGSSQARRVRSALLVRLDRRDEAIVELKAAFDRDARSAILLVEAGELELALTRWDDARATFARALGADAADGRALAGLARAHLGAGDLDAAAAAADRAAAIPGVPSREIEAVRREIDARRAAGRGG